MICRCACILLLKFQSEYEHPTEQQTATTLYKFWPHQHSVVQLSQKVATMVSAGSYYKNIEQSLGIGAALVLGKDLPETTYVIHLVD